MELVSLSAKDQIRVLSLLHVKMEVRKAAKSEALSGQWTSRPSEPG
jgi:hypothetical protein